MDQPKHSSMKVGKSRGSEFTKAPIGHPLPCVKPKCGVTFDSFDELQAHYRNRFAAHCYRCPEPHCNGRFSRKSDLNRHARIHNPGSRTLYCCFTGCPHARDKPFYRRDKLLSHQRNAHGNLLKPHILAEYSLHPSQEPLDIPGESSVVNPASGSFQNTEPLSFAYTTGEFECVLPADSVSLLQSPYLNPDVSVQLSLIGPGLTDLGYPTQSLIPRPELGILFC